MACSIGIAVLEVIKNEKLISSTRCVGKFMLEEFRRLFDRHRCMGDVRGMGLMIGVELVVGRPNLKPASELAKHLAYKCVSFDNPPISMLHPHNTLTFIFPD